MALFLALLRLVILIPLVPYALDWRSPTFASVRMAALAVLIAVPLVLIVLEYRLLRARRPRSRPARLVGAASLAAAAIALGMTLASELRFQWIRAEVLRADPGELEPLGRHLIVGFRDATRLDALIERRAIGGVFLGGWNVQGKTAAQLGQEIAALQEVRRRQGLAPLWIAADQEGGIVSRLSPPLARLPPISEVVAAHRDRAERLIAVGQYAARQGRGLAALGVNLNLAPVVDLDHRIVNPSDRLSRIRDRAISADPGVVAEAADVYCTGLQRLHVRCTLKHFPGLGRVFEDTHVDHATLSAPVAELAATDWVPFRKLATHANALLMLGHARLLALDAQNPVSISQRVIADLLRTEWSFDGLLVTDDFSMGAVYYASAGIAGGAVAALNAGVDIILVAYDPDQYYTVMYALLQAKRRGTLRADVLARSQQRLEREKPMATAGLPAPERPN